MTAWKWSMLAILPLMYGRWQRLRTWGAVFASSMLAWLLPLQPDAYIVIDLLCGALVLTKPAGLAQRAIGLLFAAMLIVDVGYRISPQLDGGVLYYWALSILGWMQWAVLACWGAHDFGKFAFRGHRFDWRTLANLDGVR